MPDALKEQVFKRLELLASVANLSEENRIPMTRLWTGIMSTVSWKRICGGNGKRSTKKVWKSIWRKASSKVCNKVYSKVYSKVFYPQHTI